MTTNPQDLATKILETHAQNSMPTPSEFEQVIAAATLAREVQRIPKLERELAEERERNREYEIRLYGPGLTKHDRIEALGILVEQLEAKLFKQSQEGE